MVGKKRGKKFDISNKLAYTLIVIALIIGLGVGVIANSVGTAPNPGHLLSTISPDSPCSSGQVLTWNGANIVCSNPAAGNDPRFTILTSGLCYDAPATCSVSGLKYCYYDQWYSITASCGSMSQGMMSTACGSRCPSIACNGDSSSCVSGKSPLTVSNSVTSASCSGTWIDCHCQASGNYYEEIYTPSGQRCV